MIEIMPSSLTAPEVLQLFSELDDFFIGFLGKDSAYYARYGANEKLDAVWLAYCDGQPAGCVAYRAKPSGVGEVKRLFVGNAYRGRGISKSL
nr:GNAT family N-acetyltransferase [Clostridia bacterium]